MSDTSERSPLRHAARPYVWLWVALAVGALCRFWDLTGPSLFIDEGWVFHISEHSPGEILQLVAYTDFHPPLFYLAAHFFMTTLHWPLWQYRYLTSAFSLLGIAATWGIGRRAFDPTVAAIAAVALAVEPALVEFDRLFRMYAVFVALGAISWWLLLQACESKGKLRWGWWAAYGVSAVALPYVQYVGVLVVASQCLYALVKFKQRWPALVCAAAAAVALVPWLWALRIQYPHGGLVARLDSPDFSWVALIRAVFISGAPIDWLLHPGFDLTFAISACAITAVGVYLGRKTLLPFWLAPVAVHVVASLVTGKDLVVPRYLYIYVPACCIALGVVVSALLRTKIRVVGVAALLLYFGISAISVYNHLFVQFYQFPDWYAVNVLLLQHEKKSDVIVMDQGAEYWIVHEFSGFRDHQLDAPAIPSDLDSTIRWLRGYPKRRIWYIENQPEFADPNRRIMRDLDGSRRRIGSWLFPRAFSEDSVRVVLYGFRLGAGAAKSVVKTTSP